MASAGADRTERATPKRREEARKEGQVARSLEVNSAFAMFAGFAVLMLWGPRMFSDLAHEMSAMLRVAGTAEELTSTSAMTLFRDQVRAVTTIVAPVLGVLALVGVIASVVQVRPKVTPSVLRPRLSKINPINGFKQRFSPSALVELGKQVAKMLVVGVPAAWTLYGRRDQLLALGDVEPAMAGAVAAKVVLEIGFKVAAIYIVVAIADYFWQRHRFEKSLRMTKQEVKQEMRQQDIAPELKSQQRRRQREMARRRMLADVPTADVVITNPTHYSVALRYDPDIGAPQVVAKGVDLLALRIREIAEDAGVMRVENVPLARALYAKCEVGQLIPAELFTAVAEVLAFVYRTGGRAPGSGLGQRSAGPARRLEHA